MRKESILLLIPIIGLFFGYHRKWPDDYRDDELDGFIFHIFVLIQAIAIVTPIVALTIQK